MNRIDMHVYFLRYLSVTNSYQRRHLLQTATTEQLNVLYEIAFNVLQGNISLTDEDYSILYKHRNVLRKLTLKEIDRYTKRQLLGKNVQVLLKICWAYFFTIIRPKIRKTHLIYCLTQNLLMTQMRM